MLVLRVAPFVCLALACLSRPAAGRSRLRVLQDQQQPQNAPHGHYPEEPTVRTTSSQGG